MTIQQEDNKERGAFYIEENGNRLAELAYTWRSDSIVSIDHTEVDESLEGKGVAKMLIEYAISFARETGIKFILYCPFAKVYFARHKEYSNLLAPQE